MVDKMKQKKLEALEKRLLELTRKKEDFIDYKKRPPKLSYSGPITPKRDPSQELTPEDEATLIREMEENRKQQRVLTHSEFADVEGVRKPSVGEALTMGFRQEITAGAGDEIASAWASFWTSEDPKEKEEAKKKIKEIVDREESYYRNNWKVHQRELELANIHHPRALGVGRAAGFLGLMFLGGIGIKAGQKAYQGYKGATAMLPELINKLGISKAVRVLKNMGESVKKIPGMGLALNKPVAGTAAYSGLETAFKSGTPIDERPMDLAGEVAGGAATGAGVAVTLRGLGKFYQWADKKLGWTPTDLAAWITGRLNKAERSAIKSLAPYLKMKEDTHNLADEIMDKLDHLNSLSRHLSRKARKTLKDDPIINTDMVLKDIEEIFKLELNKNPQVIEEGLKRVAQARKAFRKRDLDPQIHGPQQDFEDMLLVEVKGMSKAVREKARSLGLPEGYFPVGQTQNKAVNNLLQLQKDVARFTDKMSEKEVYDILKRVDDDIEWRFAEGLPEDRLRKAFRRKLDKRLKRYNADYAVAQKHTSDILNFKGTGNPKKDKPDNFLGVFGIKLHHDGTVNREVSREHLAKQILDTGRAGTFTKRGLRHKDNKEKKIEGLYQLDNQKTHAVRSPTYRPLEGQDKKGVQPKRDRFTDKVEERDQVYDLREEAGPMSLGKERPNPIYDDQKLFEAPMDKGGKSFKGLNPVIRIRAAAMNDHFEKEAPGIKQGSMNVVGGISMLGPIGHAIGSVFGEDAGKFGFGAGMLVGGVWGKAMDHSGRKIGKRILTGETSLPFLGSGKQVRDEIGGRVGSHGTYTTHSGSHKPYGLPEEYIPPRLTVKEALETAAPAKLGAMAGAKMYAKPWNLEDEKKASMAERLSRDPQEVPSMNERKRLSRSEGEYRDAWRDSPKSFEEKEEERRGAQRRAIEEYLAQQDGKTPPKRFRKSGWR